MYFGDWRKGFYLLAFLLLWPIWPAAFSFLFLLILPSRVASFGGLVLATIYLYAMGLAGNPALSRHGVFLVSLGIALASIIDSRDRKLAFECSLASLTSIYFISGIWKLRDAFRFENYYEGFSQSLQWSISFGLGEAPTPSRYEVLLFFSERPFLSAALWAAVIVTQILSPIALSVTTRFRIFAMMALILFHIGSQKIVGPNFAPQVWLLVYMSFVMLMGQFFPRVRFFNGVGRS